MEISDESASYYPSEALNLSVEVCQVFWILDT